MKKLILSLTTAVSLLSVQAQMPFRTIDSINVNNINAAILVHGDLWWNPETEIAHCNFPNGTQKNISFTGALWMSGHDAGGKLHVAAQTYRQDGNDYWPGPLDSRDTLTYETSSQWAKIWKINRSDIQYFQTLPGHDTTNTPLSILTWPGAGNIYARGKDNVALIMYTGNNYAPFVDLNSNGIYEPLLGEYPDVPGDQALWWMFSDNGPSHNQTDGLPLGVEIHALAYAYSRGTLLDNIIYYRYDIVNRSANTYADFRLALWVDQDLGYYNDDYIGFDSSHRMGITYNGTNCDGCDAGSPLNSYGTLVPVAGITMLALPEDNNTGAYMPVGSFGYYNNDASVIGNPTVDTEYDHYIRGEIRSGAHFTDDFEGPGTQSKGYGSGSNTNYVFNGDPGDHSAWSECTSNNNPGDRRFIISSNSFNMLPGSVNTIAMALVTTNPDSNNACPDVSFDGIKTVADTAWAVYHNPPSPLPLLVANTRVNTINVYPDPAHDQIHINGINQYSNMQINVYNTLGQALNVKVIRNGADCTLDINNLVPGVYYLFYKDMVLQQSIKFTKD